ncbi:ParA family protein [uncultured Arthrobacter sp.]|uniref:ParA family protein n=1 Tax=uncultured Arthrobacter sp. TaxID=114050 RepID=UPI0032177F5E
MSSSEASTQRIPPFVSLGSARAFSAPALTHNISAKQTGSVAAAPTVASVSRETSGSSVANVLDSIDDSSPIARELAHENKRRESLLGRELPKPEKTRIFTVSNQKGGVGKTTTTVNIAAALAAAGLNVLVIDIDPQGNASTALGIEHHADVDSIYDVLINDVPLQDVVAPCPDIAKLICAPATIHLAGAEIELVSLVAREQRLRRAIDVYAKERAKNGEERLDYIFIDCPPSLGLLTVNAFCAASEVLIPIQCEYYALEGLSQLLKNIEMIQKHLNADLVVSTILLTMYDGRTNLAAQVAAEVREHFPEQVLGAVVPRSVRISEAPSYQQTVMTYDPSSSGALSYLEAAAEIAER